jgi:hypothetical protein
MPGQENNICLHDYYYSLEEIAELFEGKLRGKIVHFSIKSTRLESRRSTIFLDITNAKSNLGL